MTKENYFKLFKDAETKEELLLIEWKTNKKENEYENQKLLEVFKKAYKMLDKIEVKEQNVIDKLILEYNKGNDVYKKALEICEEKDLIIDNIDSVLNDEINRENNNDKYKIILNKLRYLLNKGMIKSKTLKEQNIDYSIAKKTFKVFLNSDAANYFEFNKITKCPRNWFKIALSILEVKKSPLYYEYKKRKEETMLKRKDATNCKNNIQKQEYLINSLSTLSKEEMLQLMKNRKSDEFKAFCSLHHLNRNLINALITTDANFIKEFIEDSTIYYVYEEYYKNLIRKIIEEIKESLKDNKNYPFNLYEYYQKINIPITLLASIAQTFNDIQDKQLIKKYLEKNSSVSEIIDIKTLKVFIQTNRITCGNDTILFTNNEINQAIADINEKNIPLNKGTLYGAIKHQKELVKKKIS